MHPSADMGTGTVPASADMTHHEYSYIAQDFLFGARTLLSEVLESFCKQFKFTTQEAFFIPKNTNQTPDF